MTASDRRKAEEAAYRRALGKRLREVRLSQGLSLSAVEQRSEGDWPAVVIGSWERGDRRVFTCSLVRLARFYGVPAGTLLTGTDEHPDAAEAVQAERSRIVALIGGAQ